MSLSRWYDETPLRLLRWINSYRYGWLLITAIILIGVSVIGLVSGWFMARASR